MTEQTLLQETLEDETDSRRTTRYTYISGRRVDYDIHRKDRVKLVNGDVIGIVRRVRNGVVYVLLDELTEKGNRRLAGYLPDELEVAE